MFETESIILFALKFGQLLMKLERKYENILCKVEIMKVCKGRTTKVSYMEGNQFHFLLLKFGQLFVKLQKI